MSSSSVCWRPRRDAYDIIQKQKETKNVGSSFWQEDATSTICLLLLLHPHFFLDVSQFPMILKPIFSMLSLVLFNKIILRQRHSKQHQQTTSQSASQPTKQTNTTNYMIGQTEQRQVLVVARCGIAQRQIGLIIYLYRQNVLIGGLIWVAPSTTNNLADLSGKR